MLTRREFIQFLLLSAPPLPLWADTVQPTPVVASKSNTKQANGQSVSALPSWFVRNRVQGHTRLTYNQRKRHPFQDAGKRFREMGAQVFTRHVKSKGEGAWWPSQVGAVVPEVQHVNLAQQIIDEAHDQGCYIIAYYRHLEDDAMVAKYPQWGCVDWRGRTLRTRRGQFMCFNSPYADYVETRLKELAKLGADGFYFDEMHMPQSGCWCDFCRQAFTKATGLQHPPNADWHLPAWQALSDFTNTTITQTFTRWKKALQTDNLRYPVFLISSYRYPGLTDRHLSHELLALADSVKTEFASALRERPDALFRASGNIALIADAPRQALGILPILT